MTSKVCADAGWHFKNGDVQQVNNVVYVRLDEKNDLFFKKNTTMMTTGGKQALDNLAQVFGNRSNVNLFVGGGDSAAGVASSGNMPMDNDNGMSGRCGCQANAPPP